MITPIDLDRDNLDIYPDFSITRRFRKSGPPERVAGMTLGYIDTDTDAPHNGEVHPDGDEILLVISGKIQVTCDSHAKPLILGPRQACIIPRGEWHKVIVLERSQFIHITPGPRGEYRL